MHLIAFLITSLFFICDGKSAETILSDENKIIDISEALELAEDVHWKKLLHFKKDFFGVTESQVDSDSFFISEVGKKNPKEELKSTILAFLNDDKIEDSFLKAQCRFPARYRWLKKKLALTKSIQFKDSRCERFEAFSKGLNGKSVSIVFSSYFLNNPSSAFGHIFLRLNKSAEVYSGHRRELLDYGLNFSADVDTENAFLYGFKGLFGLFPGRFKAIPYYIKVREYNNAESRDLWEYQLNLNSEAMEMLVAHVWELGPTNIDYWYLTENCSYHIISLLEAADPNIDVLSSLNKFVIPSDTIRILFSKDGLIENYKYRASIREIYNRRFSSLSFAQKNEINLLSGQIENDGDFVFSSDYLKMPKLEQADVLDTFIEYMDFQYSREIQVESKELQRKLQLLDLRSQLDAQAKRVQTEPSEGSEPHLSHPSRRIGIGLRELSKLGHSFLFSHRLTLHDRLDPLAGYPSYSQLNFFDLEISIGRPSEINNSDQIQVEKFSVVDFAAMNPWSRLHPSYSWRLKVGYERNFYENSLLSGDYVIKGGGGYTYSLGKTDFSLQLLVENHLIQERIKDRLWYGFGPLVELHHSWSSNFLSQIIIYYRNYSDREKSKYINLLIETQWSFKNNWGIRVSMNQQLNAQDSQFKFFHYY